MRNIFILIFILSIYSFSSSGSPSGNGIVCKCIECNEFISELNLDKTFHHRGYFFENEKIIKYFFEDNNDQIFLKNNQSVYYWSNSTNIKWSQLFEYKLNRKNLSLEIIYEWNPKIKKIIRKCEVYSKKEFFKKLNQIKKTYELEKNDTLRDNKI